MSLISPFLCSRTMQPSFHSDGTVCVSMHLVNSAVSLFHTSYPLSWMSSITNPSGPGALPHDMYFSAFSTSLHVMLWTCSSICVLLVGLCSELLYSFL